LVTGDHLETIKALLTLAGPRPPDQAAATLSRAEIEDCARSNHAPGLQGPIEILASAPLSARVMAQSIVQPRIAPSSLVEVMSVPNANEFYVRSAIVSGHWTLAGSSFCLPSRYRFASWARMSEPVAVHCLTRRQYCVAPGGQTGDARSRLRRLPIRCGPENDSADWRLLDALRSNTRRDAYNPAGAAGLDPRLEKTIRLPALN